MTTARGTRAYARGGAGGGGVSDHGALTGLGDDDHPQYLLRSDIVATINRIVTDIDPDGFPSVVIDGGNVVID